MSNHQRAMNSYKQNLNATILLLVVFLAIFLPQPLVSAEQSPEQQLVVIGKLKQRGANAFAERHNAELRMQYGKIYPGGSFQVPTEELGTVLEDQNLQKASMNTFLNSGTLPELKNADSQRYLQIIKAKKDYGDLPLNDVKIGVIDTLLNVEQFKKSGTPSSVQQFPYATNQQKKKVRKDLSESQLTTLKRKGTLSARLIAGPSGTGVAPGVNLHFFSTLRAVALHSNTYTPGKIHMEALIGGLNWFKYQSNPRMDAVFVNAYAENPSKDELLKDAVNSLSNRRTVIITPAGDNRQSIEGLVNEDDIDGVEEGKITTKETLPANYNETVAVSALDQTETDSGGTPDKLAEFSNYGEDVQVTAPGFIPQVLQDTEGTQKSKYEGGTAISAALVTGGAALTAAELKQQTIIDQTSDNNLTKQVNIQAKLFSKYLERTGSYPSSCTWKNDPDEDTEPLVNISEALRRAREYPRSVTEHELIWDLLLGSRSESHIISIGGYRDDGSIMTLLFPQSHFPKKANGQPLDMSFFGWGEIKEIKQKIRKEYQEGPHGNQNKNGDFCRKKSNIVIFAHGLGASSAVKALQQLHDEGIQARSLITIDGVHHKSDTFLKNMKLQNVGYWANLHLTDSLVDLIPAIPGIGHMLRGILSLTEVINIPATLDPDTGKNLEDEIDDLTEPDDAARDALRRIWEVITDKDQRSDTLATIAGKWGDIDEADENFRIPESANKHHIDPWEMFQFWVESHFQHKSPHDVQTRTE